MQKILFISFFLVYSIALHGQNCFGTNLFPYGDFGSGIANIAPAPNWYPQNLLRYVSTPPPEGDNEGEYTITNRVMPIPWGGHAALFWIDTRNSSPDPNGYMMVIDAKNAQGAATPIWREEIELCGSATYEFSVDVINLFNPTLNAPTIYEPNLSIRLNGVVLENYNGGVIPRDGRWHTYRTTINIPDGASNYVLDLFHKSEKDGLKAYGGDFAIDNISLRRCEPTITIPTNINICSSAPFTIDATIINLNFPNPVYQWQQSNDNGLTWQNIAGANTPQLTINAPEPGRQYRLVLAERIALLNFAACQVRSNVTTLNVQTSKSNIQRAICAGRQIEVAGNTFNQAGTYTITTTNRAGCDSMITLNLSILPNVNTVLNQFICNGETFNFFGQALTNAGTYQMTLTAKNGCDSIITLSLNLRPSIEINQTASICEGESYVFEGQTLTQAGTYQAAYKTISGCDSLINLRLSVLQHSSHLRTIELCAGETFEGKIYTANQIVETKLVNAVGCDSLLTTNIIVRPIYENVVNLELCENSIFQGQTITSDVRITNRQLSIFGCDSITHFDIRVLRPVRVELVRQICIGESFTFAGQARQTAGQYTEVLVGSNGCDSVIVLNLEVLQSIEINQTASICEGESYVFEGQTLTQAGNYQAAYKTISGCDSLIHLRLNVLQHSSHVRTIELCAGETFEGKIYTANQIVETKLVNAVGCDSLLTTNIIVRPIYENVVNLELCENSIFQGQTITSDVRITNRQLSIFGCDSITHFDIRVLRPVRVELVRQICIGESFTFAGQARQTAGQYTEVLTGSNGCDSVTVLNLQVLSVIRNNVMASICEDETYVFGNRQLTSTGVFVDTLPSVNGCDSIITLTLNVLQKSFTTINVALCAGETYQGQAFRTDTILTDVLPNAVGCDSIITTIILINPIYAPTVEVALCKGDFFQNQNIQTDTAITITYATINGCDSIVTYQIIVEDLSDFKIKGNTSVCPDETTVLSTGNFAFYEWSNGASTATIEANEVGWYGVTITSALGCMASDSIFVEATALTARVESNAPRCFSEKNGSIQIINPQGGTAPYQYALNGKIQDIPIFTNLEAGNYNISILDAAGCVLNLEYELTQPDLLQVELGEGATLALGEVIELTPVVNRAVNFKWQPAEVLSCVDCQNPIFVALTTTNVFLEVTDAQGCQAKTNVRFVVDRYRLYAPNVFSPNGDSNNDRFKIFPGSGVAKVDYLKIYDRWGSLIFEQINPDMNALEWDGQSKNQLLSTGNYSWVLSIQLVNGRRELLTGEVLLVN
jgi:gliding motility-associated-like protein